MGTHWSLASVIVQCKPGESQSKNCRQKSDAPGPVNVKTTFVLPCPKWSSNPRLVNWWSTWAIKSWSSSMSCCGWWAAHGMATSSDQMMVTGLIPASCIMLRKEVCWPIHSSISVLTLVMRTWKMISASGLPGLVPHLVRMISLPDNVNHVLMCTSKETLEVFRASNVIEQARHTITNTCGIKRLARGLECSRSWNAHVRTSRMSLWKAFARSMKRTAEQSLALSNSCISWERRSPCMRLAMEATSRIPRWFLARFKPPFLGIRHMTPPLNCRGSIAQTWILSKSHRRILQVAVRTDGTSQME